MPYVDPWGGTVQGLKTLGDTFDTLEERRVRKMEMDRQARRDALDEPYMRLRNEEAATKLRTLRELDEESRANRAARKAEEAGFTTATVPTSAEVPVTPLSAIRDRTRQAGGLMDVGEGAPVSMPKESLGMLPTETTMQTGQGPMTESEKNHARLQSAMQRGDMDTVQKLGNFVDVSDKIDGQGAAKIKQVLDAINSIRNTMGPTVALREAKRMAAGMGMPPEVVNQIVISPQGIVSWPDGQGGTIATVPTPDGKYHVVHSAAKEPTYRKETLEERTRHNKEMEKLPGARVTASGEKKTALMKNAEFLTSLGWDKKEAANMLSSSKPMSRESFVGNATLKVYTNELIPEDEKANRVKEAITFYDSVLKKTGGVTPTTEKILDKATAASILKEANGDKEKARKLAKDRGYKF